MARKSPVVNTTVTEAAFAPVTRWTQRRPHYALADVVSAALEAFAALTESEQDDRIQAVRAAKVRKLPAT